MTIAGAADLTDVVFGNQAREHTARGGRAAVLLPFLTRVDRLPPPRARQISLRVDGAARLARVDLGGDSDDGASGVRCARPPAPRRDALGVAMATV